MISAILRFFSLVLLFTSATAQSSPVEVMHWWTSGGELKALNELRQAVENTNNTWVDAAIKGGGGNSALTVLRSRAVSGNPPAAALIKGHNIQEWASLGFLTSLNDIAERENWDEKLPQFIQPIMKYKGNYVAVPINIHRVNWLWFNPALFQQANLSVPKTLDQLIAVMPKLQSAGILPFAHTSEPWADAVLFESIALSVLGAEGYQRAFVDLDTTTLSSPEMHKAFGYLRQITQYIDDNAKGRSWDQATKMLVDDQTAMQIMGDWVLGELGQQQQKIRCQVFPGSRGSFSYNVDSFAFFKLKSVSANTRKAQNDFASTILNADLQRRFNYEKGSLPIIKNIDETSLSACDKQAYQDYNLAKQQQTLVPTFAQAMATTTYVQSAMSAVISQFIYNAEISNSEAVIRLNNAIKAAL